VCHGFGTGDRLRGGWGRRKPTMVGGAATKSSPAPCGADCQSGSSATRLRCLAAGVSLPHVGIRGQGNIGHVPLMSSRARPA
jgi:hypothetical protein